MLVETLYPAHSLYYVENRILLLLLFLRGIQLCSGQNFVLGDNVFFCSLFYEKEGFYCQPKELPDQEFGGVAVALGQKVSSNSL